MIDSRVRGRLPYSLRTLNIKSSATFVSDVYSLCVAYPEPLADRLYNETKTFLEEHVGGLLENRVKKGGDQSLLKNYFEAWKEFSQGITYLHMLYSYLNNQHIRKQKMSEAELTYGSLSIEHMEQMKEIGELGLDTWKRLVSHFPFIHDNN